MVTEIGEQPSGTRTFRKIAHLDLVGDIRIAPPNAGRFQRGVTEYPSIGDNAMLLSERELRLVYGGADADHAHIGDLQQDTSIGVHIDIDNLVSRHFAMLGATGVGKSSGVAIILQKILDTRPNLRIFLVDPHNEYGRCFGDKAQVLTPRNLRLPFWLFNFEETIDAFFGGRPGVEEEIEILSDVIPLAKAAYLQYRPAPPNARSAKKKDPRDAGFTADTPVPYRIEDLHQPARRAHGQARRPPQRVTIHRLMTRIQTFRNHPRYAFMFENANIGGDTMAEILGNLFRLPPNGKPMTIMQLAGFPAEVIDSVVSVLCRMAFDFGLWSDGVAPLLFVCEEAHRYAPADKKIGFGPTRRALVAHRQGRPQIRRLPRAGDAAAGGNRPHHHFPVLDVVLHAAVQRARPGADPLGGVRRCAESVVVHPLARRARSLHLRPRRRGADAHALQRDRRKHPPQQRSRRQYPLRRRHQYQPRPDVRRDRSLAQRQHEPPRDRGRRLYLAARRAGLAAFGAARPAAAGLRAVDAACGTPRAAAPCRNGLPRRRRQFPALALRRPRHPAPRARACCASRWKAAAPIQRRTRRRRATRPAARSAVTFQVAAT